MGKKRIITKGGETGAAKAGTEKASTKRKIASAVLNIAATFNNTKATLTDKSGNTVAWSSAGSLGFKGTKKGTPFAASRVGDFMGGRAKDFGVTEADIVVRGVGSGRESAIRGFISHGIDISSIKDRTPVPHNGPKPPKPRRV